MKRFLLFFIISFFVSQSVFSQNNSDQLTLKFNANEDGKLFTQNAVGQKIFSFDVQGLTNQKQADEFITKFSGKPLVLNVTIPFSENEINKIKGVIILKHEARFTDFKKLLQEAGIPFIFIDEKIVFVDQLEKIKN